MVRLNSPQNGPCVKALDYSIQRRAAHMFFKCVIISGDEVKLPFIFVKSIQVK